MRVGSESSFHYEHCTTTTERHEAEVQAIIWEISNFGNPFMVPSSDHVHVRPPHNIITKEAKTKDIRDYLLAYLEKGKTKYNSRSNDVFISK